MYLEEMINAEYSRLNENDILIWQYIQLNKRECCEIAIEDLAQKCCISRTTISDLRRNWDLQVSVNLKFI